jgi:hypothetical protein
MTEARNLRLIASLRCSEYRTGATCFINSALPSGRRRLVVHCDNGGYAERREFTASIPDDSSEQDVMNLLLSPMKDPSAPYQLPTLRGRFRLVRSAVTNCSGGGSHSEHRRAS